jgi:RNA polymerase primary sigma factor
LEVIRLSIEDKYDDIKQLVYDGKQKGYLLYDEVNDVLPSEIINSSDDIDELFTMFDSVGIEVVDSEDQKYQSDAPGPGFQKDFGEDQEANEQEPENYAKTYDPVRMYLREMGVVPLLTREGEITIAKRIESHKENLIRAISQAPIAVKEVLALGQRIKKNKNLLPNFFHLLEDEYNEKNLDTKYRQVQHIMERISRLDDEYVKLKEKMKKIVSKAAINRYKEKVDQNRGKVSKYVERSAKKQNHSKNQRAVNTAG